MVEHNAFFNNGRFPDNETRSMVDKDTRSNGRTWMDLNLGPKTPELAVHPRQELKTMVPQKVGNTVSCQSKGPPARYALLGHFLLQY